MTNIDIRSMGVVTFDKQNIVIFPQFGIIFTKIQVRRSKSAAN